MSGTIRTASRIRSRCSVRFAVSGASRRAISTTCHAPLADHSLIRPWESVTQRRIDLAERLSNHSITVPNGCVIWTGVYAKGGYGQMKVDGQMRRAHRVAYQVHVGPIPDGLVLDHLCRERGCINWRHVEPVTISENVLRDRKSVV